MKKCCLAFLMSIISLFCSAQDSITISDIQAAEKIISLHFTLPKEDSLVNMVQERSKEYDKMHRYSLDNSIPV
ncbi:MAG: hypothetical protein ABI472_15485 [Ginsengibacter sp.]